MAFRCSQRTVLTAFHVRQQPAEHLRHMASVPRGEAVGARQLRGPLEGPQSSAQDGPQEDGGLRGEGKSHLRVRYSHIGSIARWYKAIYGHRSHVRHRSTIDIP